MADASAAEAASAERRIRAARARSGAPQGIGPIEAVDALLGIIDREREASARALAALRRDVERMGEDGWIPRDGVLAAIDHVIGEARRG